MGKVLRTNRRSYRTPLGLEVHVLTVLVEGSIGDYAAYTGVYTDAYTGAYLEHEGLQQGVEHARRHGDKLSFAEARIHFPDIEEARYRR